jgi:hypothetical protein
MQLRRIHAVKASVDRSLLAGDGLHPSGMDVAPVE